jgi:hypothetical protein
MILRPKSTAGSREYDATGFARYRTAIAAYQRAMRQHRKSRSNGFGGPSKGSGGGSGGMDALTAFQNIMAAHIGGGEDIAEHIDVGAYYDLHQEAVTRLELEGIPWENGIYDKDHDGIDFEEEVEALVGRLAAIIAQEWLDGDRYIPEDVLHWAFYEVSDHNNGGSREE